MFTPNAALNDAQRQVALEVYRQKYETYRHLDRLRWQTPAILFAAAAIIGVTTEKGDSPSWWVLLLFATFSGCCWYLMRRIRGTINRNTTVLQEVGEYIGDDQIPPPPGRRGAAYLFEFVILVVTLIALAVGLFTVWQ